MLVVSALFVVRPQVAQLHKKVAESLTWELGRPVQVESVHIRFLPRPGLELHNFAIYDNEGFGSEPMLRSPEVTAWLRLSSLLRRRIEISSLNLTEASLNLSRDADGKWNVEDLLQRASRSSTAPTASGRTEPRREFPYIEAGRARINFKNGVEKTHFALTNAEFALWQDSENEWGMRLKARPIRTDANLTDTGTVKLSAAWQRSGTIESTPVQISLEWKEAQIGQLSKLFSGSDKGWRGSVLLNAAITGTLGNLLISTDVRAEQLRRWDVLSDRDLQSVVHCGAEYDPGRRALLNIDCNAPAGDGTLELKGATTGLPFVSYGFGISAKDVPVQSVLELARHIRQAVSPNMQAIGIINADVAVNRRSLSSAPQLSGRGEILGLKMRSQALGTEVALGTVPVQLLAPAARKGSSPPLSLHAIIDSTQLQVGPANTTLGRSTPVQAELLLSRAGYQGALRGEAGLKRLLVGAQLLRIPVPQVSAEGDVTFSLSTNHLWGQPSVITGTAQLRSVRAQLRGLNSPLQIRHAELAITPEVVRVTKLEASAGPTTWRGSLSISRPCATPDSCSFQFHLRSPQLSAAELNQLVNPAAVKRPWYRLLSPGSSKSFFLNASATGSLDIDQLVLGQATCDRFSADLEMQKGTIQLTRFHANVMGGESVGTMRADFSLRPPAYSGTGTMEKISLQAAAKIMQNPWVEGSGSATYNFKSSGWSARELLQAAELHATFKVENSIFPHVVLTDGSEPLHASSFAGQVELKESSLSFQNAELDSDSGVYTVSGSASLTGKMNLKLTSEGSTGYSLSGTIAETRVSPIANPSTRAALKQ